MMKSRISSKTKNRPTQPQNPPLTLQQYIRQGGPTPQTKVVESTSTTSQASTQAPAIVRKVNPSIVLLAFNKHIAVELSERIKQPGPGLVGTEEQEAIWKEGMEGTQHVEVQAVAGSGKTSVAVELCRRLGGNVDAMTYHSLGNKAIYKAFGPAKLDEFKVWGVVDSMGRLPVTSLQEKMFKARVAKMVELTKQYGKSDRETMEWIIEHHDVELNGMMEDVLLWVPRVLEKCKQYTKFIDYNDMIWLPFILNLPMPQYDLAISDEAQDLSVVQQKLALRTADRHMFVGDSSQSVYSFRGADSQSMASMRELLGQTVRGIVSMPLTLTRRCPKQHVRLAQLLVPQIKAMDTAPEGRVSEMTKDEAIKAMRPGDMVLCRVNADLMMTAYQLLKRGVKAVVRGKDIGKGISYLIEKAETQFQSDDVWCKKQGRLTTAELIMHAGSITDKDVEKLLAIPHGRGEMRAELAKDKYSCLLSLSQDTENSEQVKDRIKELFKDFDKEGQPNEAVVLSSVHRGKGLEAGRVFVLRPDLMPHPASKQPHEIIQEANLAYVAVTRVKHTKDFEGELIWVGKPSVLFGSGVTKD